MIESEIGQYRILDLLGEGGMGDVYKALDVELDRLVALKFLKAEFGDDRVLIQRFRDELRVLAGFNHRNITTLYTTFTWQSRPVMVMELVEGETLLSMVNRRGPIPAHISVPLIQQALAGVGEAHRKNIVHRDLKPSNLMLSTDGVVKVMDFGIAKIQNSPGLTRSNAAIGTCLYMAPEQIRGTADKRTDIYAMGVTLYQLLAGTCPFCGDSEYDIQTAHINQAPQPPTVFYPHIPEAVTEAVMRSLAKDPAQRFQCAEDFSAALGDGAQSTVAVTAPESAPIWNPVPDPQITPAYALQIDTAHAAAGQQPAHAALNVAAPASPSLNPATPDAAMSNFAALAATPVPPPEPLPSPLDRLLERWFGRTGRPRQAGAAVGVAALLFLGVGSYFIAEWMKPAPTPDNGDQGSGEQASHHSAEGSSGTGGSAGKSNGEDKGSLGGLVQSLKPGGGEQNGGGQGSTPSNLPPAENKADASTRPATHPSELAGRWTGSYERCEDNRPTQATMELNEPSPGAVSGTLVLSAPGGAVARCSVNGVYMAEAKSFTFYVPSCGGARAPAYLTSPHRSLLRLAGGELTGDVEPQDACVTARFRKM